MNQKVLTVLEYNKIIDMLVAKATSPLGREKAGKLKPMDDIKEIRAAQAETRDALSRLFRRTISPLQPIRTCIDHFVLFR